MRAQSGAARTQFERQRPNVCRGPVELNVAPEVADGGTPLPRARQRHLRECYNPIRRWLAARIRNLAVNLALAGDCELGDTRHQLGKQINFEAIAVLLAQEAPTANFEPGRFEV